MIAIIRDWITILRNQSHIISKAANMRNIRYEDPHIKDKKVLLLQPTNHNVYIYKYSILKCKGLYGRNISDVYLRQEPGGLYLPWGKCRFFTIIFLYLITMNTEICQIETKEYKFTSAIQMRAATTTLQTDC